MSSGTAVALAPHPESHIVEPRINAEFFDIVEQLEPRDSEHQRPLGRVAMDAADMEHDKLIVAESLRGIGAFAMVGNMEIEPVFETNNPMSLDLAIHLAAEGDEQALEMVRVNAKTDLLERAFKSGVVLPRVRITKTSDGKLIQYGQLLSDMHRNSLRYIASPVLRNRTRSEVVNGDRLQYYSDHGLLQGNVVVTFSLVTSDFSEAEAEEAGFFTDTMSLSMQLVSEDEEGVYLDAAFVAGRESSVHDRFDEEVIRMVVRELGLDFSRFSADEMLAHPIIIPKSAISSLIEIIKVYDQKAQVLTGKRKLFGRESSDVAVDYNEHIRDLQLKMEDMNADIEDTIQQLLAAKDNIKTPVHATKLLDNLNDMKLKKRIVSDLSIDANVLGQKAAYYVNHARYLQAQHGVHIDMLHLQEKIEAVGRSRSCPDGTNKAKSDLPNDMLDGLESTDEMDEKLEDCEFISKECPKCHQKNVPTRCEKGVYIGDCGCRSDEETSKQTKHDGKRNTNRVSV